MPTSASPASVNPVVRAIVAGQLRHILTIAGTAAIAHGFATQGQVDSGVPQAADYITGVLLVAGPMAWSALSKIASRSRWAPGWRSTMQPLGRTALDMIGAVSPDGPAYFLPILPDSAVAPSPCLPVTAPADLTMENDMNVGSALKKVLGFVAGILIPGASADTTDLTHEIQQEIANAFGTAAKELAEKLALDTTGMTGSQKVFAIVDALVATAAAQGIKADAQIIEAVALDVAQAAYRATLTNLESGLIALASSITASGGLKTVTTLVIDGIEALEPLLLTNKVAA